MAPLAWSRLAFTLKKPTDMAATPDDLSKERQD